MCLLAAAAVSASAAVPQLPALQKNVFGKTPSARVAEKQGMRKAPRKAAPLRLKGQARLAAPTGNETIIDDPQGTSTMMTRTGIGYGYSWLMGSYSQTLDGTVSYKVVSDDGKKVYLNNPFSQYSVPGYLEGTVDGNTVSLKLPQLVDTYLDESESGETELIQFFAAACEYVEDDEGAWYYPTETQEYKLTINADGSLTPTDPNLMLGEVTWFDEDEEGPAGYFWQGNGDLIENMTPFNEVPVSAPEGTEFESWNAIVNGDALPVQVSVGEKDVYIKGLFAEFVGLEDATFRGELKDGKIVFPTDQYLGIAEEYSCTFYFRSGKPVYEVYDDGTQELVDIEIGDFVCDYNPEKKIIKSNDMMLEVTPSPNEISYYMMAVAPVFACSDPNAEVTALPTPIFDSYWEAEPEYGLEAEVDFLFPNYDSNYNVLDTSKLYYNLILDNEVFTFYTDEYTDLTEDLTDVPYDLSTEGYQFNADGSYHCVYILPQDFTSLGIRTLYKDGDKTVYSEIMWVPGFAKVNELASDSNTVSTRYYDLQGCEVRGTERGIMIRADRKADGSVSYRKIAR